VASANDASDRDATVIVVGSINADLVVTAPTIVRPGETIAGSAFSIGQGGKGANQACAAASAGAHVVMVARVGDDAYGRDAVSALDACGVDTTHVASADAPTGVALIQVDARGENAITVVAGANARLSPHDVDAAFGAFATSNTAGVRPADSAAAIVVLCLEIPLETVTGAAIAARRRGWTVVLNPAPAPTEPLPPELLAAVDVIVPNEREAAALGMEPVAEVVAPPAAERGAAASGAPAAAARRADAHHTGPAVLLTRGARGATLLRGDERHELPAPRVQPVDTTGAGDAFIGVLAASLAQGVDLVDAARRAVAGGAIATLGEGARGSLPTASAIDRLLASHG